MIGLRSMAGHGMGGTEEAEDQALERLRGLADETVEQARRVRKQAGQAAGAVTQAHQQAAMLQERLGHPDRAASARAHAEHARQLQAKALQEQRDQER